MWYVGSGDYHLRRRGALHLVLIGVMFSAGCTVQSGGVSPFLSHSRGSKITSQDSDDSLPDDAQLAPAELTLSSSELDFETAPFGATKRIVVLARNQGARVASQVAVASPSAGQGFSLVNNQCGTDAAKATVAPGEQCSFEVEFAPVNPGASATEIALGYHDGVVARSGPFLKLKGNGVAPASLAFFPSSLDFGSQTSGTSRSLPVTLTNSGDVVATELEIALSGSGFILKNNQCGDSSNPAYLAPNESCSFEVEFSPTAMGASNSSVSLRYHNGATHQTSPALSISGNAVAPGSLTFNPTSYDFQKVILGSSPIKTITLANNGTTPVNDTFVNLSGSSSFRIENNSCGSAGSRQTIAPGTTCSFDLVFAPTSVGSATASVGLSYFDGAAIKTDISLPVRGMGVTPATLSITPSTIAFPTLAVGAIRTAFVQIQNTGGLTASGTRASLSVPAGAPYQMVTNSCGTAASPVSIVAGGGCSIQLRFSPTTSGSFPGSVDLQFHDGSAAQTRTVAVSGAAQTPAVLQFPSSPVDFGKIVKGTTRTRTVSVSHSGQMSATEVYLSGSPAEFVISSSTCGTFSNKVTIAPGTTCGFTVTFAPSAAAVANFPLNLYYQNGSGSQATITLPLLGEGIEPLILAAPDVLYSGQEVQLAVQGAVGAVQYTMSSGGLALLDGLTGLLKPFWGTGSVTITATDQNDNQVTKTFAKSPAVIQVRKDLHEKGYKIAVDGSGSVWVAGVVQSTDSVTANQQIKLIKYSAQGVVLNTYWIGDNDTDEAVSELVWDSFSSRLIMVGVTNGNTLKMDANGASPTILAESRSFIVKFDPANPANHVQTWLGSPTAGRYAHIHDVAVDASTGAILVGGEANDYPVSESSGARLYGTLNGALDGFVAKFDKDLKETWRVMVSSAGDDIVWAVAFGPGGKPYFAGENRAQILGLVWGGGKQALVGGIDETKLLAPESSTGYISPSKAYGSSGYQTFFSMAISPAGSIYLAGNRYTLSVDDRNFFVARYSPTNPASDPAPLDFGSDIQANSGSSFASDTIQEIRLGTDGNLYGVGHVMGTFSTPNSTVASYKGSIDLAVLKFGPDLSKIWIRSFGSAGEDKGIGCAVGPGNEVFATGYTNGSIDGQATGATLADTVLLKLDQNGNLQ